LRGRETQSLVVGNKAISTILWLGRAKRIKQILNF
jgi:hypothetical protein